jgi:hypothetical protein
VADPFKKHDTPPTMPAPSSQSAMNAVIVPAPVSFKRRMTPLSFGLDKLDDPWELGVIAEFEQENMKQRSLIDDRLAALGRLRLMTGCRACRALGTKEINSGGRTYTVACGECHGTGSGRR